MFALAVSPDRPFAEGLLVFVILHLLVYPASNAYNSYFDRDEQSIGGLKNPPKVLPELFWWAWALDVLALALGFLISWTFVVMLLVYGLVSKAYSHPWIRLKKRPIAGWLTAGVFQGAWTFSLVIVGLNGGTTELLYAPSIWMAAGLSSLLLFGSYPMTQIYQHQEDRQRGDRTLSLILGVQHTFHFTAIFFTAATGLLFWYFTRYYHFYSGLSLLISLAPVLIYFGSWYYIVRKDETEASYERTMLLNLVSATCLNSFFFWFCLF